MFYRHQSPFDSNPLLLPPLPNKRISNLVPGEMVLWTTVLVHHQFAGFLNEIAFLAPTSCLWLSALSCGQQDRLGLGHTNAIHGISHLTLRTVIWSGPYYHPSLICRERSNKWVSNLSKVIKLVNYGFKFWIQNPWPKQWPPGIWPKQLGACIETGETREGTLSIARIWASR